MSVQYQKIVINFKKEKSFLTHVLKLCFNIICCATRKEKISALTAIFIDFMDKKQEVIALAGKYIRDVPDFPKPGIIFKDIVPVFENPEYLQMVFDVMVDELKKNNIQFDKIACPEARGFLFGPTLGLAMKKGVVMARKPGKLPCPGESLSYDLEYGSATLVVSKESIKPGDRVVVVDDLLATGGSAKALCQLVEKCGGTVAGVMFYIELTPLKGREVLKDYPVISIVPVEAY